MLADNQIVRTILKVKLASSKYINETVLKISFAGKGCELIGWCKVLDIECSSFSFNFTKHSKEKIEEGDLGIRMNKTCTYEKGDNQYIMTNEITKSILEEEDLYTFNKIIEDIKNFQVLTIHIIGVTNYKKREYTVIYKGSYVFKHGIADQETIDSYNVPIVASKCLEVLFNTFTNLEPYKLDSYRTVQEGVSVVKEENPDIIGKQFLYAENEEQEKKEENEINLEDWVHRNVNGSNMYLNSKTEESKHFLDIINDNQTHIMEQEFAKLSEKIKLEKKKCYMWVSKGRIVSVRGNLEKKSLLRLANRMYNLRNTK